MPTSPATQTVILTEKPSQGRDIAQVIGAQQRREGALFNDRYIVTWCIGHLLEMSPPEAYDARYKRWSLETLPITPSQWKLTVRSSAQKQFNVIKSLLQPCRSVIIATDADREGEVIAREVLDKCRYKGTIQRLWLSALDPKSIRKAFSQLQPDEKTRPLYHAGLARSRADWLVGMNLSRFYTLLAQRGYGQRSVLSVGRVQTPTLRLVVDRDREIEAFKPQPYWDLIITAQTDQHQSFLAKWQPDKSARQPALDANNRCLDEQTANALAEHLVGKKAAIRTVTADKKSVPPPLGYDLSSLQTEASSKWGFSADKTLKIAQSLYETHKVCSYPRTSCTYLPESQFNDRHDILEAVAHNLRSLQQPIEQCNRTLISRIWNQKKVDEAAHHGIIPTAQKVNLKTLSDDERRVYDRICRRYIAQFYGPHQYRQTIITLLYTTKLDYADATQNNREKNRDTHRKGDEHETFIASGKVILEPGWHNAYTTPFSTRKKSEAPPSSSEQPLPSVKKGEMIDITHSELQAKKTQPPPRFTEGSLIRAMKSVGRSIQDPALKKVLRETSGIGQEATRAGIIKTLLQREYLKTDKKRLISTPKGRALIDAVPELAKSPETTALWEQALDDIAQQRSNISSFIQQQQDWITTLVNSRERPVINMAGVTASDPAAQPTHKREQRRKRQHLQQNTRQTKPYKGPIKTENRAVPPNSKPNCPACGREMKQRQARSGKGEPFWGCSGFPSCRQTLSMGAKGNDRK